MRKSRLAQALATIAALLLALGAVFGIQQIMADDAADAHELTNQLNKRNKLRADHTAPQPAPLRPVDPTVPVVSITFDDGNTSNARAGQILAENGLTGTFYVISAFLESPNYLNRAELDQLVKDGNEIGGHTLHHRRLTTLTEDEVRRQVCNDRDNLLNWGYEATSFAYPEADSDPKIQRIVADCGYNSARSLGGVRTKEGCDECAASESFTPKNPYLTNAPAMITNDWSVDYVKELVTDGITDGGWLQLTFHDFCEQGQNCSEISWQYDDFEKLVGWLAKLQRENKIQVRNVNEVITGKLDAAVPTTPTPVLAANQELVKNGGLEETLDSEREPATCWESGGFGKNEVSTRVGDYGVNGSKGGLIDVASFTSGDAKLLIKQDMGECSPEVKPGQRYRIAADFQADDNTQFSLYLRGEHGQWVYWTSSPMFRSTDKFDTAEWVTPEIPDGYDALSFGLALTGQGQLRVDNYSLQIPPREQ